MTPPMQRISYRFAAPGVVALVLAGAMACGGCTADASEPAAHAKLFDQQVRPFLVRYCAACHGESEPEAGLRIDTLPPDFATPATAGKWIEVMDRMNLGEMPPEETPDVNELTAVTGWIASELRRVERANLGSGGKVVLRRMNRDEYTHTVRDLLGLTFCPAKAPWIFCRRMAPSRASTRWPAG